MAGPALPQWQTPSQSGQLCNFHGANTGADAIALSAKYSGPGGPSGIRVTAQRNAQNNNALPQPSAVQDSTWVGTPATAAFPVTASMGANSSFTYNGRIYVLVPASVTPSSTANTIAGVLSASVNGPNIGNWRWENPVQVVLFDAYNTPYYVQDSISPGALCRVGGFAFVLGLASIYMAPINSDGSLGRWTNQGSTAWPAGSTMAGWQNQPTAGWLGKVVILTNASPSTLYGFNVGFDGTVQTTATITTALSFQRGYGMLHLDNILGTFVIGGEDGSGVPQAPTWRNDINYVTDTPATWSSGTATALPAARSRFGGTFWLSPDNAANSYIYAAGGVSTGTFGSGTALTSVLRIDGQTLRTNGAWTTYTNALPTLTKANSAAVTIGYNVPSPSVAASSQTPPPAIPVSSPLMYDQPLQAVIGEPMVVVIGGSGTTDVQVSNAHYTTGSWYKGASSVLTGGALGTGGSVTANQDGTYTVSFNLADKSQSGFGATKYLASLNDGDAVELGIQFVSNTTAEASPSSSTLIKVGQVPVISGVSPSGTPSNGQPTANFTYTPGAGGADEYSWQLQIKQGANVIFDTGTRLDKANSTALSIAPLLLPSTAYSTVVNTSSQDTPMTGSLASSTSTVGFTTTAFSTASAPTSPSATPDGPNARVALAWTGTSSYARIYYRRNGSSTWLLYADSVAGTSYTAMDHLAIGVGYDFAFSLVNATPGESALSSTVSNVTIPAGSFSAYLHVAGQGTTYGLPVQVQGSPSITGKLTASQILGFNQLAPVARYSLGDYHLLSLDALLLDTTPATLKQLQALTDQVQNGSVCFYRDALGGMLVVTFDADQSLKIQAPYFRQPALKLTETLNLVGPYVSGGSAQGYLALKAGSRPPIDSSERLL